ncbi:hypothetical protein Hypma_001349 [Hypsizygus marmoreus]|uniref:C3H1-type domain-containing protein n=1 Tax=Hypsizygus marmoreus TaxID=39966 RepID=A0A369K6A9_HYPMA|nr:hypothetical protein Hypma_001349 [Hypsizygus marmoreus]
MQAEPEGWAVGGGAGRGLVDGLRRPWGLARTQPHPATRVVVAVGLSLLFFGHRPSLFRPLSSEVSSVSPVACLSSCPLVTTPLLFRTQPSSLLFISSMAAVTAATTDVTAMQAQLTALSATIQTLIDQNALRPAVTPLDALLGLPANPLALPPGANGAYPVIQTSHLHPHLLSDVTTQVERFELPPTNLGRLLPKTTVDTPVGLSIVIGPNGEATFVQAPSVPGASALLRDVPDVLTFTEAWSVFTSVLQNAHRQLPIAQALTAHLANIVKLSRSFIWSRVLDYHVAFMLLRTQDPFFNPINWMRSEAHLHMEHLLTSRLPSPSPAPTSSSTPPGHLQPHMPRDGRVVHPPGFPVSQQPCWNWNKGACGPDVYPPCPRRHICQICMRADHSSGFCPSAPGAPGAPQRVAPGATA